MAASVCVAKSRPAPARTIEAGNAPGASLRPSGVRRHGRFPSEPLGHQNVEGCGLAAQDPRAQSDTDGARTLGEQASLLRGEAALGPDEQDDVEQASQRRERRRAAGLVGHDEVGARRKLGQPGAELDRFTDGGNVEAPALFGGLGGDRHQPIAPGGPHDRAARHDEVQRGDAELDGFLDEPVEPVRSDRCDRQAGTRLGGRRPQPFAEARFAAAPVEPEQLCSPLATRRVEQPHRGSRLEAQHVAEPVRLLRVQLDDRPFHERSAEVETWCPIVMPHRFARPPSDARRTAMHGQASEAVVADQELGWVVRLPPRLRDLAMLARWDRPIGTWLLLLPCWWGQALAPAAFDPVLALLFAIGAIAMRGAGCTVNDLLDRDFDRRVARTRNRPLAAGRLGVAQALAFVAVQCLVGLLVLLQLPPLAVFVGLASVPLIVVYPLMKRVTWWPQAVLGVTFNWGVLVGYTATAGTLDLPALLLYAAGIAWTLGYDTIYAHQDKEDDRLVGVRSSALRLGEATPHWLVGFYGTMLVLLAAAGWLAGKDLGFWLLLPAVAWSLARQLRALDLDDPRDCIRRFRMNRLTGLLVVAALLAGGPWSVGPGAAAIAP